MKSVAESPEGVRYEVYSQPIANPSGWETVVYRIDPGKRGRPKSVFLSAYHRTEQTEETARGWHRSILATIKHRELNTKGSKPGLA